MRLAVRHVTSYSYSRPVTYAIQTLRLTPRPYDGLAVMRWQVRGGRNRPLPSFTDGLGNVVHTHSINRPHRAAAITVDGVVETRATDALVGGAAETMPPQYFLRHTPLTAVDDEIAALAGESRDRPGALMERVRARLDYRKGVTHSATTASQALRQGYGVCQDHAHVFIAACRALGIPARYVSGYLWTGDNGEDEASHAWAEAYIAGSGWLGFDPSNATQPGETYIRLGVGLDYWSAAPVRGIRRGDANEALAVTVKVTTAPGEQ